MRCLYCGGGVPWRPLKWLIDDDFCSKSHRNSYHERFRKAINNLSDLQIHPNDPLKSAEFLLQLPQLLSNSTGIDPMLAGPSFAPSEMFLCAVGVAPLVVLAEALPVLDLIQPAGSAYPSRYRDVAPSLVFQARAFKLSAPVNGTLPEHRLNAIGFQDLAVNPAAAGRLMAASPFAYSGFRPPRPLLPAGLVVALAERPELLPKLAQPIWRDFSEQQFAPVEPSVARNQSVTSEVLFPSFYTQAQINGWKLRITFFGYEDLRRPADTTSSPCAALA